MRVNKPLPQVSIADQVPWVTIKRVGDGKFRISTVDRLRDAKLKAPPLIHVHTDHKRKRGSVGRDVTAAQAAEKAKELVRELLGDTNVTVSITASTRGAVILTVG